MLTGDEDKDLPRSPAWKITGPLPAEWRMDDGQVNTSVFYKREKSRKTLGI